MKSTVWDQIYKNYQEGGEAWATLSRGLEPDFKIFVEKTKFPEKKAFDVGYGTGHYLQYLKAKGFSIAGIDSSQTAYEMASKVLGQEGLVLGDVYNYEIPNNSFDLIISISAIHHGTKVQVEKALNQVFHALTDSGFIYITLPIDDGSKKWKSHRDRKEIAPGTFVLGSGPEKGLAHSYYTKDEVEKLFSRYKKPEINSDKRGRWHISAQK